MLPSAITFDWGPEGKSTWLQMTMERLGVTVIFRPKATPGSGANIETLWRKLCQELLHRLKGATALLQKARMVTKAVNPHNRAVWTQAGIRELVAEYYELINDLPRRGRMAPNYVLARCLEKFGPPPTQMPDVEMFRKMLLPLVENITRTVTPRGYVRHREHSYFHDDLRQHEGKDLVVRFDKNIIKKVWVTLPNECNRMVECEVVDTALKYLPEEEAMAHHLEVYEDARKRRHETERRMAAFVTGAGRKQKAQEAKKAAAERLTKKATPSPTHDSTRDAPAGPAGNIVAMPIKFKRLV